MGSNIPSTAEPAVRLNEGLLGRMVRIAMLLVWLSAGLAVFLPFAFDTSPWNAVTLHVPGNQGNWWHVLVGAPFFLAYPMIWLRLRGFYSPHPGNGPGLRLLAGIIVLSALSTLAVQTPFLLHLAGTSEWQRLAVLSLGSGTLIATALILFFHRRRFSAWNASVAALNAAYLANAALCLVVYSGAAGSLASRSGWFVTMGILWPMILELGWLLFLSPRNAYLR